MKKLAFISIIFLITAFFACAMPVTVCLNSLSMVSSGAVSDGVINFNKALPAAKNGFEIISGKLFATEEIKKTIGCIQDSPAEVFSSLPSTVADKIFTEKYSAPVLFNERSTALILKTRK